MNRPAIACTLGLLALAAMPASAQSTERIESFGVDGDAVPAVVRSFLSDDFFVQPVTEGLASGLNYVASVPVPRMRDGVIELEVTNTASRVNDIVLSASRGAGADTRNFIVHLEPGTSARIDARAVAKADRLYFVSMQSFTAEISVGGSVESLTVFPPAAGFLSSLPDTKGGFGTCGSASRTISICSGGGCVTAKARRFVLPQFPGEPQEAQASIQYPIGTSFHCSNGSSVLDASSCTAGGYATRRCSGSSAKHYWSGLDDTILYCGSSSAFCTSGCSGSWSVSC